MGRRRAGKLIASSLYKRWPRLEAEAGGRRDATGFMSARDPSVMASAAWLQARGWPEAFLEPELNWCAPAALWRHRAAAAV